MKVAARRRDADRLRLRHPHRRRPPVRRRARQRPDGAAAHAAQERRHRRDHDQRRAQAEPRLADLRRRPRARAARSGTFIQAEENARAHRARAASCSRRRPGASTSTRRRCSRTRALRKLAAEYSACRRPRSCWPQVGYGKLAARQVLEKLVPDGQLQGEGARPRRGVGRQARAAARRAPPTASRSAAPTT